ncbi:hypothetical protein Ciccas_006519 [Cichlidogyrus casuarinus]|uniref:Uncharacterized protein n=1 Tax=Cichlidogyrus casuarinus TaxID=1844966 RepID=A0ABD2Q5I7_9PLAT
MSLLKFSLQLEKPAIVTVADNFTNIHFVKSNYILSSVTLVSSMTQLLSLNFDIFKNNRHSEKEFFHSLGDNLLKWFFLLLANHSIEITMTVEKSSRCRCSSNLAKLIQSLMKMCSNEEIIEEFATTKLVVDSNKRLYRVHEETALAFKIKDYIVLIRSATYAVCFQNRHHKDIVTELRKSMLALLCEMDAFCLPFKFIQTGRCEIHNNVQLNFMGEQRGHKSIKFILEFQPHVHFLPNQEPYELNLLFKEDRCFFISTRNWITEMEIMSLHHLLSLFYFYQEQDEENLPVIFADAENAKCWLLFIISMLAAILQDRSDHGSLRIMEELSLDRKRLEKSMYTLASKIPSEVMPYFSRFQYAMSSLIRNSADFDAIVSLFQLPVYESIYSFDNHTNAANFDRDQFQTYIMRLSESMNVPCKWSQNRVTAVQKSMKPLAFNLTSPHRNVRYSKRFSSTSQLHYAKIFYDIDPEFSDLVIHQKGHNTWIYKNREWLDEPQLLQMLQKLDNLVMDMPLMENEMDYLSYCSRSLIIMLAFILSVATFGVEKHKDVLVQHLYLLHEADHKSRITAVFNFMSYYTECEFMMTLVFIYELLLDDSQPHADILRTAILIIGDLSRMKITRITHSKSVQEYELNKLRLNDRDQFQLVLLFWSKNWCSLKYVLTVDGNDLNLTYDENEEFKVPTNELLRFSLDAMENLRRRPEIMARTNSHIGFLVNFILMAVFIHRMRVKGFPHEPYMCAIRDHFDRCDQSISQESTSFVEHLKFSLDILRRAIQAFIDNKVSFLYILSWFHFHEPLAKSGWQNEISTKHRVLNSAILEGEQFGYQIIEQNSTLSVMINEDTRNRLEPYNYHNAISRIIVHIKKIRQFDVFLHMTVFITDLVRMAIQFMSQQQYFADKAVLEVKKAILDMTETMKNHFSKCKQRVQLVDQFKLTVQMAFESVDPWYKIHNILRITVYQILLTDEFKDVGVCKRFPLEYVVSGPSSFEFFVREDEGGIFFIWFVLENAELVCKRVGYTEMILSLEEIEEELIYALNFLKMMTFYDPPIMIIFLKMYGYFILSYSFTKGCKHAIDHDMYGLFLEAFEKLGDKVKPPKEVKNHLLNEFCNSMNKMVGSERDVEPFVQYFQINALRIFIGEQRIPLPLVKESDLSGYLMNRPANKTQVVQSPDQKYAAVLTHSKRPIYILFEEFEGNLSGTVNIYDPSLGLQSTPVYAKWDKEDDNMKNLLQRLLDRCFIFFVDEFLEEIYFYFLLKCVCLDNDLTKKHNFYMVQIRETIREELAMVTSRVSNLSLLGHLPKEILESCIRALYLLLGHNCPQNMSWLEIFAIFQNYCCFIRNQQKIVYNVAPYATVCVTEPGVMPIQMSFAYRHKMYKFTICQHWNMDVVAQNASTKTFACQTYNSLTNSILEKEITSELLQNLMEIVFKAVKKRFDLTRKKPEELPILRDHLSFILIILYTHSVIYRATFLGMHKDIKAIYDKIEFSNPACRLKLKGLLTQFLKEVSEAKPKFSSLWDLLLVDIASTN